MIHKRAKTVADDDTDQEIRAKRLRDPEVQARLREIQESLKRGDPPGPGISGEELSDFLREHG